ncbi:MAG: DNA-deoxyinosine glycosylase, partial [Clostridia bacterium]|nr:DNA-deoxyinosine glycosylase [Clostridia bacterium]
METDGRIFCFAPVADENSRILVLGSAPSETSLRQGFYYAHPRNAFWPILCEIFGEAAASAEQRRLFALRHGIALWDTIGSCMRAGSLDASIRDPEPNDIAAFLRAHPSVERILLNGGTAYKLYKKHTAAHVALPAVAMPSTSPAHTMPYAQK